MAKAVKETSAEVMKVWSERNSMVVRHHDHLMYIRCIVEMCEKRRDKTPDSFAMLRNVYDEGRKIRVEAHVAESCDLSERVTFLTSFLDGKNSEMQAMLGLELKATRLWQELAEAWKNAKDQNEKSALLGQVVGEISTNKKDVSNISSF